MTAESLIESHYLFYDDRWREFGFANRPKLLRCASILEGIASTKLREPRMIDLGCGAGWLTSVVGIFGPTVGVDLSREAIQAASAKWSHVEFKAADILDWDYPKAAFDIVISQEVIEHMENQKAYLDVAHGLLREGGYLILTTPNARTFRAMPERQQLSWTNQPLEKCLTIPELREILRPRFKIKRLKTVILGHGVSGMYRYVNSARLRAALERIGLAGAFDQVRSAAGFGLHSFVLAGKA